MTALKNKILKRRASKMHVKDFLFMIDLVKFLAQTLQAELIQNETELIILILILVWISVTIERFLLFPLTFT